MRIVTDTERRARLARRHGLAAPHPSVEAATEAMTALHATEAATVHLALWARLAEVDVAEVDRALYRDRTVVKQLAMRRTLFVFPRDLLPAAWGGPSARTADAERARTAKDVVRAGIAPDGEAWLAAACAAVLVRLADGVPRTTARLREEVPELAGSMAYGRPGAKWAGTLQLGPRVITLLGAEGRIVRAVNEGHWRLNRPTWTTTESWLGETPVRCPAPEAYAAIVRRWLWTFGPGTEADLVWWLGATKGIVRAALREVEAVEVALEDGRPAWLLPDDVAPVDQVEPWAALLPTLDPTVMGWRERSFYLRPEHTAYLFDSNGNAGNTAWWDGRVVGAWAQDDDATVRLRLCEEVDGRGRAALAEQAERLTAWLDGVRIANVYTSALMRGAPLP